jgi:methanogenic corrinoid protein MtbC1
MPAAFPAQARSTTTMSERFADLLSERLDGVGSVAGSLYDDVLALSNAVRYGAPVLFADYTTCTSIALLSRGVTTEEIARRFEQLRAYAVQVLPAEAPSICELYLSADFVDPVRLASARSDLEAAPPLSPPVQALLAALLAGDVVDGLRMIRKEHLRGMTMESIYLRIIQPSLVEIGRLWELNRLTVAREHVFSECVTRLLAELDPYLQGPVTRDKVLVAGTVPGERHQLGIRMVCDFFAMKNWFVHYLGGETPVQDLAAYAVESRADVLALSVTLVKNVDAAAFRCRVARQGARRRAPLCIIGRSLERNRCGRMCGGCRGRRGGRRDP